MTVDAKFGSGMDKTKKFIDKAKKVWGENVFDYKDVVYVKNNIPVVLWYNGIMVEQTPKHHLAHHMPIELSDKKKHTNDELIKKFNEVHNSKYSYGDFKYIDAKTKNIPVYCKCLGADGKEHGWWNVSATNHLSGCGCPKCKSEKLSKYFASNTEDFIAKAKLVHNGKYTYDKVKYINNTTNVIITCSKHGDFSQTPHNHLQGKGCPKCNESNLEKIVESILTDNSIKYIPQYREKWLGKQSLDFYLPDYNVAIECQGEQHYKPNRFSESLETIQNRDKIKLEKCVKNGVKLLYFANEKYNKEIINNSNELIKSIDETINIDKKNISEIHNFLKSLNVKFTYEVNKIVHDSYYMSLQDIFTVNDINLKIIYVNSYDYRKKNEEGVGVSPSFFISETKKYNSNGYNVIWVKDYEMIEEKNGYKRKWEVIKSYIRYACNLCENKIFARNCEIHEVPNNELKVFLDKNCFYGYRPAKVNLGLYLKKDCGNFKKGDLVMVYTFGNNFYGRSDKLDTLEVIRVSTILNSHVVGGSSKLLNFFEKNYKQVKIANKTINVKKLIFYVDADHNNGKSLQNSGFEFIKWVPGFMNVNSIKRTATMRKPFKNDEINKLINSNQMYISPTNGVMVFNKILEC